MSSGQQVIKVLAIIFAIFLIVNIIGGILMGVSTIFGLAILEENGKETSMSTENVKEFSEVFDNVNSVEVSTAISKLTIQKGNVFKVEAYNLANRHFTAKVQNNTLIVKEDESKKFWNWNFGNDISSNIVITIPENVTLNELIIKEGVGNNSIQDIKVQRLRLESGVGNTRLDNITVTQDTQINGGAGRLEIKNSELTALDLDGGVGEMTIHAKVTGNSKVDCGVGQMNLQLQDTMNNYTIVTKTGLGTMRLNGEKCNDDTNYGSGVNKIKVSAGVGSVNITTID